MQQKRKYLNNFSIPEKGRDYYIGAKENAFMVCMKIRFQSGPDEFGFLTFYAVRNKNETITVPNACLDVMVFELED